MNLDALDENGEPMIKFIWSSEEITKRSNEYWRLVLDIATKFNLERIKRCTQIMGRKNDNNLFERIQMLDTSINELFNVIDIVKQVDHDKYSEKKKEIEQIMKSLIEVNKTELATSQIFYPVMQCADIFFLNVDICSLGLDQKKVNMLALEYCDKIKRKLKPIIVSHHMLMGLDGSDKMSKSNPDNTIFMDDNEVEIKRKIKKAFCEPNNIVKNPLLDWIEHLILPIDGYVIIEENNYTNIEEIKKAFLDGNIHPKSLKESMTNILINKLRPIQQRYKENIVDV